MNRRRASERASESDNEYQRRLFRISKRNGIKNENILHRLRIRNTLDVEGRGGSSSELYSSIIIIEYYLRA